MNQTLKGDKLQREPCEEHWEAFVVGLTVVTRIETDGKPEPGLPR